MIEIKYNDKVDKIAGIIGRSILLCLCLSIIALGVYAEVIIRDILSLILCIGGGLAMCFILFVIWGFDSIIFAKIEKRSVGDDRD